MLESFQHKQTREFFEKFSKQWSKNAKEDYSDFVNTIKIRNDYVEKICKKFVKKNSKILDVGCGTGDLVIKLSKKGFDSEGVDFASSMIDVAKKDAKKHKISEEKFSNKSFFEYTPKNKLDLISANGFIEYISEKELEEFINKSYNFLNKEGYLVFESRNRLFNCFSFNQYTEGEIEINEISNLLRECILFNESDNLNKLLEEKFQSNIKNNLHKHEITNSKYATIKVDTRYQYTPMQLISILKKTGFEILDIYPVHVHAISTGSKEILPKVHTSLSYYLLEQNQISLKLIPQCSSFMILAKKNG